MSQALLLSDPVPSVSLHDGRPATTSLEVAKFFGKTHFHVMRSIKDLIEQLSDNFNQSNFGLASYLDEQAKSRPMYIIKKDGFMLLVMGYTGKKALALKLAYIEAFNRMEAELAKRNRPALPAAPRFDEAAMLELAAEIREAQQHYYRTFGRLCSRLISMSIPVFTALESRVYKQAPDRPFSGVRIGAQWERYFTERMTAALHSLDDRLPDEKNPAMLLLEYARMAVTEENVALLAQQALAARPQVEASTLAEEYPGDFARIIGLHTYSQSPHRNYDIRLTGNWVERGGFRFEDFVLTRRKEENDGND